MRYLFLHVGYVKTGSSAIQSWLANNSESLAKRGFSYTVNEKNSLQYRISSGNGHSLRAYLLGELDEVGLLDKYFKHDHSNTIISSEMLPLNSNGLDKLKDFSRRNQLYLKIIAYLRNPVDLFYSVYVQNVKRNNYLGSFEDFLENKISSHPHIKIATRMDKAFDDIRFVHYNSNRENIIAPFCDFLEVQSAEFELKQRKVNRSISFKEIKIIQLFVKWRKKYFNDLDTSKISWIISDWLVNKFYNRKSEMLINDKVLEVISNKCADQVASFNADIGKRFGIEMGIGNSANYDNLTLEEQSSSVDFSILRDVSAYLASQTKRLEPECLTNFAEELKKIDYPSYEAISKK